MFDPRPMRPLLKAVIKLTEALRLGPDVPVVSHVEGDIDAIVYVISNIMIGAWKVLHPLSICVHNLVLVLQKQLGAMRERTHSQGEKGMVKVDTFFSAFEKLQKSHAGRSLTKAKIPSTVGNESKTSQLTTAGVASNKEPNSTLATGLGKHRNTVHFTSTSFPERKSSLQAQKQGGDHIDLQDPNSKAQLGQLVKHRTENIQVQPSDQQTFIPGQSCIGRAQVTRCSLPALIEYLTNCELQPTREQFVTAFFITWDHICYDHLAAQITSKQMQVFSSIKSRELLAGRWMVQNSIDAPRAVAMCQLTNGVSNWVKESVLTEAEPRRRGQAIETWILIAQHLFQLSNFDGLVAVTSGLDDISVLRLKQCWDAVSVQAKESFRSLQRIVDPSENRKTLRNLFSSSPAPRLPFVGSYLSQLVFANEYHKVKKVEDGEVPSGSDEKINQWGEPFAITPDIELQMWIGKRTSEFWCADQNCLQEIYYEREEQVPRVCKNLREKLRYPV
ncbi:Ras guanine-nucleotide exchange protein [Fusarium coicis]|nr:Ras guanine-nucleotide exchange protein [Fusarium coicis]